MHHTNLVRNLLTALYFYLIFILGVSIALLGPSLRLLARQTNVGLAEISVLAFIMPIGFISGVYICRYFLNSPFLKHVIFFATLFFGILLAVANTTGVFLLVCAIFFAIAISQGIFEVISNVKLVELYKKNPAPYLNAMHFCFGVGAVISPVLIGYNIKFFDSLLYAYLILGALAILPCIAICLLPIKAVKDDDEEEKPPRNKDYTKILIAVHLFFFIYIFIEAGYTVSIFPFLREEGLMDAASAGIFTSMFWLVFTVFRLVGTVLSIYFNPLKIALVHGVVSVLGLPLMLFGGDTIWLYWLGNIIMGAGLSVFFPCILAYCEMGFKIPSKSISNFFVSATVGAMSGSWLLLQLLDIEPYLIFYPLILSSLALPAILYYMSTFKTAVAMK